MKRRPRVKHLNSQSVGQALALSNTLSWCPCKAAQEGSQTGPGLLAPTLASHSVKLQRSLRDTQATPSAEPVWESQAPSVRWNRALQHHKAPRARGICSSPACPAAARHPGETDVYNQTEEGEHDDTACRGRQANTQQTRSHHQEKDIQEKRTAVCSVTATVTLQVRCSHHCPVLPQLQTTLMTVSTLSSINCRKQACGISHRRKHFPVSPRCFLPILYSKWLYAGYGIDVGLGVSPFQV